MSEKLIENQTSSSFDSVCRGIYVSYDKMSETYGDPICLGSTSEALRFFASQLLQVPDVILKDYVIFEIAEYIPSKGSIVTYSSDLNHKFVEITSEELIKEVNSMRDFLKSIKDEVDKENKK